LKQEHQTEIKELKLWAESELSDTKNRLQNDIEDTIWDFESKIDTITQSYEDRIKDLEEKLRVEWEKLSGDAAAWEAAMKAEIEKL